MSQCNFTLSFQSVEVGSWIPGCITRMKSGIIDLHGLTFITDPWPEPFLCHDALTRSITRWPRHKLLGGHNLRASSFSPTGLIIFLYTNAKRSRDQTYLQRQVSDCLPRQPLWSFSMLYIYHTSNIFHADLSFKNVMIKYRASRGIGWRGRAVPAPNCGRHHDDLFKWNFSKILLR